MLWTSFNLQVLSIYIVYTSFLLSFSYLAGLKLGSLGLPVLKLHVRTPSSAVLVMQLLASYFNPRIDTMGIFYLTSMLLLLWFINYFIIVITSLTNPVTTTISCLAHCLLQILLEKVNNSPVLVMKILKKTSNLNINVSAARGGLSILISFWKPHLVEICVLRVHTSSWAMIWPNY